VSDVVVPCRSTSVGSLALSRLLENVNRMSPVFALEVGLEGCGAIRLAM
jgi:hypothetical protein